MQKYEVIIKDHQILIAKASKLDDWKKGDALAQER